MSHPTLIPHGTPSGYKHHKCRCPECVDAARSYDRTRARKIAYGQWSPWGDADQVRAHIDRLRSQGWSCMAIARAARVHDYIVRYLMGNPERGVRADTAERILSVGAGWPAGYVPADGCRRRLQALAVLGHGLTEVSRESGLSISALAKLRAGQRRWTQAHTPGLVVRAYDALSMRPAETPRAALVAKSARSQGWLPPLAWDDDLLDLPENELQAELERRVDAMDSVELWRCHEAWRQGDPSPLMAVAGREYRRRKKARAKERQGLAA